MATDEHRDDTLPIELAERLVWSALEMGDLRRLATSPQGRAALAAFVLDHQRRLWLRFVKRGVRPVVARHAAGGLQWDRRAEAIVDTHRESHPDYERVLRVAVECLGLGSLCEPDSERVYCSLAPALSSQPTLVHLSRIAAEAHVAASTASVA